MLWQLRRQPFSGSPPNPDTMVGPVPALVILTGPYAGQVCYLTSRTVTIGRAPNNDLQLHERGVALCHAAIRWPADGRGQPFLYDLCSPSGVQVNGSSIRLRYPLSHGDEIVIGQTRLRFIDPRA